MIDDSIRSPRIAASRPFALVLALIASAAGCNGFVEVGEGPTGDGDGDSASGDGDNVSGDGDNASGDGDSGEDSNVCVQEDAEMRAGYDEWKAAQNDFGELVGKTYKGYIEGDADVTLIIEQDGSAQFIVGEAAPPPTERAEGYLCGDTPGLNCAEAVQNPPVDGGVYEVHNASFDGTRLRIPLPDRAAYDQWCALQNPVPFEDDACFFDLIGGKSVEFGEPGCFVLEKEGGNDKKEVDCGWFDLAFEGFVCDCTSTECFAAAVSLERQLEIDARVVDEGFEGSFLDGESRTIYLFEEK